MRTSKEGSRKRKTTTVASCLVLVLLCLNLSGVISPHGAGVSAVSATSGTPIFSMTLIVPGDDPVKLAAAELIWMNLQQLGINCTREILNYSQISQRVLTPSMLSRGSTYDEGGFDAILLGYQLPVSPDPYLLFSSSQFAPNGMNYCLWNDSTNDQLCSLIREEANVTQRLQSEENWQSYAMNWAPSTAILYPDGCVVINSSLDADPFATLTYPTWPAVERWSGDLSTLSYDVVLAQPGDVSNLIPVFSASYYDDAVMKPVYGPAGFGLFQLNSSLTPSGYVACMAKNWTVSPDLRNWTITVRNDIRFHDMVNLTAQDVVFTLRAYMSPILNPPLYPLFKSIFGSNSSVYIGADNYTVEVRLPKSYAYIKDLLSVPILPKHVLGQFPYDQWRTLPFNTGEPSSPSTHYLLNGTEVELDGPIGAGPYKYSGYNSTSHMYSLTKFGHYFNSSALENANPRLFVVENYQVKIIGNGLDALKGFANGSVDILDQQYHLEVLGSDVSKVLSNSMTPFYGRNVTVEAVTFGTFGVQELGFNMLHPILGTGLGIVGASNPSNAAMHVRRAISYAIPREMIIQQLLQGHGTPGRTSAFCPLSEGYNSSIAFDDFNLTRAAEELEAAGYHPAPLSPGFWEAYGTVIVVIVVPVVIVIIVFLAMRTNLFSKLRKKGIQEKKIKK